METLQEPMEGLLPPTDLVELTKRVTQLSPVQKFYSGKRILITGGTGFIGKLLIEKLLRSCRDIQTIYLLIRAKHGKDVSSRVDEIFDDAVFNRLKQHNSKFRDKVVGINGDCQVTGLGLSNSDRQRLLENVHIVFHVAATVRFDEPLRTAMAINVHATQDIMELCKQMSNLKALVYVGTVYSHFVLNEIREQLYDVPMRADEIDEMISKVDDEELKQNTPNIIKEWPNTYTFTKAIAENEVADRCNGLRVGIFRPGVVVSTYKEPLNGWLGKPNGITPLTAGVYKGLLRTIRIEPENIANIVPVDMCVNGLICAGWEIGNRPVCRCKEDIPIYNYVSIEKPITWNEFFYLELRYSSEYPFSNCYWCPNASLNPNKHVNFFLKILLHYIPALFIDLLLMIFGKKPQMITLYRKIDKYLKLIKRFGLKNLKFTNDNVQNLWKKLDYKDKNEFFFNMAEIDWFSYSRNYVKGIRIYCLKDPMSNLSKAKTRYRRFKILDFCIKALFYFAVVYMCLYVVKFLGRLMLVPFV